MNAGISWFKQNIAILFIIDQLFFLLPVLFIQMSRVNNIIIKISVKTDDHHKTNSSKK